ncbi:hypothetical protein JXA12_02965 [Candidatus Woesearchaeota archaeon]|nr:hypothetical protein [Candidatus Woesearchaeota archaeon]
MKLAESVKDKKELSSLPDAFVERHVQAYLDRHEKTAKALEDNGYNEKSREYRRSVKEVRAELREIYGVFQNSSNEKREQLLVRLGAAHGVDEERRIIGQLLNTHKSTGERQDHYRELYGRLFARDPPRRVLDIGCGMNPLAYRWLPGKPAYTCCDVSEEDMAFVRSFFEQQSIDGEAYVCDLSREAARERLKRTRADTALLLKLVDTLESQERDLSKKVIEALLGNKWVRRIIISFSTRSIGGRSFRTGNEDNWFTRFLKEKRAGWDRFVFGDEEFYELSR